MGREGTYSGAVWNTSLVKDNPSPLAVMELAQREIIDKGVIARVRHVAVDPVHASPCRSRRPAGLGGSRYGPWSMLRDP